MGVTSLLQELKSIISFKNIKDGGSIHALAIID